MSYVSEAVSEAIAGVIGDFNESKGIVEIL